MHICSVVMEIMEVNRLDLFNAPRNLRMHVGPLPPLKQTPSAILYNGALSSKDAHLTSMEAALYLEKARTEKTRLIVIEFNGADHYAAYVGPRIPMMKMVKGLTHAD